MSFAIHGLGTAIPPDAVTPGRGAGDRRGPRRAGRAHLDLARPVYAHSGIAPRLPGASAGRCVRDVLDGTTETGSPFLPTAANDGVGPTTGERMRDLRGGGRAAGGAAAPQALAESGFAPDAITHLVTVSCTGFVAPGVDLALINGLGLRPTVQRTHVGFMGCHGALNGLRVANAFADRRPGRPGAAVRGRAVQPALLLRQRRGQAGRQRDLRGRGRGGGGHGRRAPAPAAGRSRPPGRA